MPVTMHITGPHTQQDADRFRAALERNTTLVEVLRRAADMDLPGWYLAAGAITQTVWNYVTEQRPEHGIDDYDLVYFDDSDLSWEAEDREIQKGAQVFAGLPARVEIRNQARVHLWYAVKFGVPGIRHKSTEGAIETWLTGTALWRAPARWRGVEGVCALGLRKHFPFAGSTESSQRNLCGL